LNFGTFDPSERVDDSSQRAGFYGETPATADYIAPTFAEPAGGPTGCHELTRIPALLGLLAAVVATTALPADVASAAPLATFTFSPETPLTQQPVTFTSTATTDPGVRIVSQEWDLNDDGTFDDASGPTAGFMFVRPGPQRVTLRVVDSLGLNDTESHRVVVGNRGPTASFISVPAAPAAGQPVTFVSTSTDPDGFIASYAWDLDFDGQFDDAGGSSVTVQFPASGHYVIGLRVTDDSGAFNTLVLAIDRGGAQALAASRLMNPFPIVRASGILGKRGLRLRSLSITAPVGATIRVRCAGRGCAFRGRTRSVRAGHSTAGPLSRTGRVVIRSLRRRVLRVGAKVRIYVSSNNAIGKYTRLKVRRNKPPARTDRCVLPASTTAINCPLP
jgi:hypothetical protein